MWTSCAGSTMMTRCHSPFRTMHASPGPKLPTSTPNHMDTSATQVCAIEYYNAQSVGTQLCFYVHSPEG
jgi:hypothetical protein